MTVVLIHGNPETPEVWTHARASPGACHRRAARRPALAARRTARPLGRRWPDAVGPRATHLLRYLAQTGTVCFGPVRDGEQLIVLTEIRR